jgi:hypothetical protein
MRVTVVHTSATAADIIAYAPLHLSVSRSRDLGKRVLVRRPGVRVTPRRRTQPRTEPVLGDTSMATVVSPARHSVGGGPRARPAAVAS